MTDKLRYILVLGFISGGLSLACTRELSQLAVDEKLVSSTFCCTRVDNDAAKKWIEAQPVEHREAAQFLVDHIRLISNQEFATSLGAAVSRLTADLKPEDRIVLVVPDKPESSELWTTRYAQALGPRLKGALVIKYDELVAYSRTVFPEKGNVYFVNVDDGAYSGDQVGRSVENIVRRMPAMDTQKLERTHLRVIRAYGTNVALSVANAAVTPYGWTERFLPKSRSVIDFGLNVPTISEVASSAPPELQAKVKAFLHEHYWDYGTLALPFHKLPDHVSFPANMMEGAGATPMDEKHPFIWGPQRNKEGPYRQAPFRN